MIAELFSSILSQGGTSNKCGWLVNPTSATASWLSTLNSSGDPAEIKNTSPNSYKNYIEAPKAQGQDRIYTHGEKEHESVAKVKAEGIPVLTVQCLEVQDLCNELGLDFKSLLGDYVARSSCHNVQR